MKRLLLVAMLGIFSTTSLTSCSNTGTSDLQPETVNQSKQVETKASAREGKELPELTESEELEMIENAKKLVEKQISNPKETASTETSRILCNTNLNSPRGHACVWNSTGHLVSVSWGPKSYHSTSGEQLYPPDPQIIYSGSVVSQCNC